MILAIFIAFMTAVTPSKIDSTKEESRYFLPYQLAWIRDESRQALWEKSFRIGATWADAFKNVRKRLRNPKRDYLFATKDYPSAVEYMESCRQFCELYNFTRSIVSSGEDIVRVPIHGADNKPTGFTEEIKMARITFDNQSRILAFSSNPNAMVVYGGDVGLDEFPRHQRAEELYTVAQSRALWGYDLAMWGSHKGNDSLFYVIAQDARKGKGGWKHFMTTIEDAVKDGLVEKINETRGTNFTRETFLADCRQRARTEEAYQEAYMCNPSGGTAAIVPWSQLELCMTDIPAERLHLEESQIVGLFGEYAPERATARHAQIENFLSQAFSKLVTTPGRHSLGYDVAASGQGDLASIYVDRLENGRADLAGLMTWRTKDWDFHKTVSRFFMRRVAGLTAAGDETGLGRQICWELAAEFSGQFMPINFSKEKHDMGFALMNRLSTAEKRFPREFQDLAADYFAMRKTFSGNRWIFAEGTNNHNANSHCDMAWSGALSDRAAQASAGYSAILV